MEKFIYLPLNYQKLDCFETTFFHFIHFFRGPGVYVRTLVALVKENMPVFFSVYAVFALSLTGGGFVALRASSSYNTTTGYHDISLRY